MASIRRSISWVPEGSASETGSIPKAGTRNYDDIVREAMEVEFG